MKLQPSITAITLILGGLSQPFRAVADESKLGLPDLEAYRAALILKPDKPASLVNFRELWDHSEAHVGRVVSIEGRLARIFRQPKLGEFPPLAEAWVVTSQGDPFCLVFPDAEGRNSPGIGASVRFSGTFLRKVRYEGSDVARLAPLIVGSRAPSLVLGISEASGMTWSPSDWMMVLGGLLVVGLFLARRHLDRPVEPPKTIDQPPSFVDGDPQADEEDV